MTFTDNAVFPTFEGVNVMLYQQSFRYAQKLMKKQRAGKKLKRNFVDLNNLKELLSCKSQAKTAADASTLEYLELCLQVRACYHLDTTYTALQESKATSSQKTNDIFAIDVERASRNHICYMMFSLTIDTLNA